jgi:DeoR/GlpR family transcriptional regulator of sugar metabolism
LFYFGLTGGKRFVLAIERRNDILSRLYADGKVIVSDLSQLYEVTEETIRRDLEKLEKEGLAKKTYGGAVRSDSFNTDIPYNVRKQSNVLGKQKIASIIADLISDGDYIAVDASTTALYVIKKILTRKNITLITNSIEVLLEVANKTNWNILSTGGALKEGGLSLVGYQAEKMIGSFHVDIAICSCKGLDLEMGITDSNEKDAQVKKALMKSASKRIIAADSSKFDKSSFVKFADINEADIIVTDTEPGEMWIRRFHSDDVELRF